MVYFKIFNPMNSVINVQNASQSTRLLASTTLRNMLGTKNLHVRSILCNLVLTNCPLIADDGH